MKDLEKQHLVKGALGTLDLVLEKLEDVALQTKLKELQKAAGKGVGKLPVKPVDTRCVEWPFCVELPLFHVPGGLRNCTPWSLCST